MHVEDLGDHDGAGHQATDLGTDVEPVERQVAPVGAQVAEAGVGQDADAAELTRAHRCDGKGHGVLPSISPRVSSRLISGAAAAAMSARSVSVTGRGRSRMAPPPSVTPCTGAVSTGRVSTAGRSVTGLSFCIAGLSAQKRG